MFLKPSSKCALTSSWRRFADKCISVRGETSQVKHEEKVLGCIVPSTGDNISTRACVQSAWSRCFRANAKALCNPSTLLPRVRYWRRLSYGAADHILASLSPGKTTGSHLDAYYNTLLRRIVKVSVEQVEEIDRFVRQRNSFIAQIKITAKIHVLLRWCLKLATWTEHIHRHKHFLISTICSKSISLIRFCHSAVR